MLDEESLQKLVSAIEIDDAFTLLTPKSLSDALGLNGEATDLIPHVKRKVISAGLDGVLPRWPPSTIAGLRKAHNMREEEKVKERALSLGLVKFLEPLPEDLLNEMAAALVLEEEGKYIVPSILDEIILVGMKSWLGSLPESTLELWCSEMKIPFKPGSDFVDLLMMRIFSLKLVLDEVQTLEDLLVPPGKPQEEAHQEPTVKIRKDGSEREKPVTKPKRKFEEKEETKKPLAKKPKLSEKNEKNEKAKEKSRKEKEEKESRARNKEKEKKAEKQREQRKMTRSRSKSMKKESESEESDQESASKSESEGSGSSEKKKGKKKKVKEEEPKPKKKPLLIENIKKGITEDELLKYTISDFRKFAQGHEDLHLTGNKADMAKKIISFLEGGAKKKEEKEKKEEKREKKAPPKKNKEK